MPVKQTVEYSAESPYANTGLTKLGLDLMNHRAIPRLVSDPLYEIESKYNLKPQRLAYEVYGTTKLWWVFSARNPSVLKDPLYDFKTGTKIFVPSKQTIQAALEL